MVGGFWAGRFAIVGIASLSVLGALTFVGARLLSNLPAARLPRGVSLHLALAFVNIILAGAAGALMVANRLAGNLPLSPLALALAHGHLAVLGWATMMIFGMGYRLIPMFLPAAMPSGAGLGISAVLLELGTLGLAASLVAGWSPGPSGLLVLGACAAFFWWIRRTLRHRRPRPIELPRHDWSTWHTHLAVVYLVVASALGCWLCVRRTPDRGHVGVPEPRGFSASWHRWCRASRAGSCRCSRGIGRSNAGTATCRAIPLTGSSRRRLPSPSSSPG